jgi:hypothetical protein
MQVIPYLLIISILISGCGDPALIKQAKQRVSANMRDPESVKFRNVHSAEEDYVCGELNAKNGFGAYTGFTRFSYDGFEDKVCIMNESTNCGKVFNDAVCTNPRGGREEALLAQYEMYSKGCATGKLNDWFIGREFLCKQSGEIASKLQSVRAKYGSRISDSKNLTNQAPTVMAHNNVDFQSSPINLKNGWRVLWRLSPETGDAYGYFFKKGSTPDTRISAACAVGDTCRFNIRYKDLSQEDIKDLLSDDSPGASYYGEITEVISIGR